MKTALSCLMSAAAVTLLIGAHQVLAQTRYQPRPSAPRNPRHHPQRP
jgi:hypothetical protein